MGRAQSGPIITNNARGRPDIDDPKPIATTVAEDLLAALSHHDISYLIANAGTDFASIIEAYCGAGTTGLKPPTPVTVPHENAAVAMAHGYYMVTGEAQAVMVHVNVGTANCLCALLNAWRDNVPILLLAGRTPVSEGAETGARTNFIHWGQEMRDQAGMLRECVKWDYELKSPVGVGPVIGRALAIANAEPRGPVYLSLPREILAAPAAPRPAHPRVLPTATAGAPDGEAIARAAAIIAAAERPLIVTSRAGREVENADKLAALVSRFALPVIEYRPTYLSLPSDHPMQLGYEPEGWLGEADAVILLDTAVPWIPAKASPPTGCPVVQIGPDPLFGDYPIRGFAADVAITSSVGPAIAALSRALGDLLDPESAPIRRRFDRLSARHDAQRAGIATGIKKHGDGAITKTWASHCIGAAVGAEAIIVNELGVIPGVLPVVRPGHYFAVSTAGGLGWGLPAALGAKLAAPDKLVVATVGDGSYMFANPVACHQTSQAQNLPILTLVFNNSKWAAVEDTTLEVHPDGHAARANLMPLTALSPSPRFDQVAAACGGYGERVETATDLPAALGRAVRAVREEGRQALLNIIIAETA